MHNRFKTIRELFNLSQGDMANKIGISKNAWHTYESGASQPTTSTYQMLLSMGISVDWLLNGVGDMLVHGMNHLLHGYSFLPLYAMVGSMGSGNTADDRVVDWLAFKDEWLRLELRCSTSDLAVMFAEGDSMIPTISPGDMLIIDHSKKYLTGDGIYVINFSDSCLVKRIQILFDGSVHIVSDNSVYPIQIITNSKLQNLIIAGRVVWHGKKL